MTKERIMSKSIYNLGRAFAAIRADIDGQGGEVSPNMVDEASTNPMAGIACLLASHRMSADGDALLTEIMDGVDVDEVPEDISVEEQGAWWCGYYQQRAALLNGTLCGETLADLRKRKGYTQARAAEALGVTQAAVSGVERGADMASDDLRAKMAVLYGVTRRAIDTMCLKAKKAD